MPSSRQCLVRIPLFYSPRPVARAMVAVVIMLLSLSWELSQASGKDHSPAPSIVRAGTRCYKHGCMWIQVRSDAGSRMLVALRGGAQEPPLPEGWEEFLDEEHQIPYFYNSVTGETVWELPEAPTQATSGLHPSPLLQPPAPLPQIPQPPMPPPTMHPEPGRWGTTGEREGERDETALPGLPLTPPPGANPESGPPLDPKTPAPPQAKASGWSLRAWGRNVAKSASLPIDMERVAAAARQGMVQGAKTVSSTNIAGLKVFNQEHGVVLKDYGLGVLSNVIEAAR
jgi:hypothetical protein